MRKLVVREDCWVLGILIRTLPPGTAFTRTKQSPEAGLISNTLSLQVIEGILEPLMRGFRTTTGL